MEKIFLISGILVISILFLLGCTTQTVQNNDSMSDKNNDTMMKDNTANVTDTMMEDSNKMMEDNNVMIKDTNTMMNDKNTEEMNDLNDSMMTNESGAMEKARYIPFNQEAYLLAKEQKKVILLEFYANWCPYCAEQKPINESTFASGNVSNKVSGFQVNFKDSETDIFEENLAKEFGITYQHTRVIILSDGTIYKKIIGNISQEDLTKLLNEAAQA